MTRKRFADETGHKGSILTGSPEEVAEKIVRHSNALGGISRVTFQMDTADPSHEQLMQSYSLIGSRVMPLLNPAKMRSDRIEELKVN